MSHDIFLYLSVNPYLNAYSKQTLHHGICGEENLVRGPLQSSNAPQPMLVNGPTQHSHIQM